MRIEVLPGEISGEDVRHSLYRSWPRIAEHNHAIFKELQKISNIDYKTTRYINLAHDEPTFNALDASRAWSDAYMVDPKNFQKEISPYFSTKSKRYLGALITMIAAGDTR